MIMPRTISPQAVDDLLRALDDEIALLRERRGLLVQLYDATIGRNDRVMESLLLAMEQVEKRQLQTDRILQLLRRRLAAEMPCAQEEFGLSKLAKALSDEQAASVRDKREQIIALVGHVRQEHLRTSLLVAECARINRTLLGALFPGDQSCVTYGAGGTSVWKGSATLLDTER